MSQHRRSRPRGRWPATALSLAAVLAVAGCSAATATDRSAATGEPAIGAVPALLDTTGLRLPVEDYLFDGVQIRLIDRARLVLIDRCMQGFGFRYRITLPAGGVGGSLVERRYGITDAALAAKDGYGIGPQPARPAKPVLTADGQTALFGDGRSVVKGHPVPDKGCLGEANRQLAAGAPAGTDAEIGQRLSFAAYDKSRLDSRVKAATQRWSACMSEQGYSYASPLAPLADPQLNGGGSAEAIKVAGVDLACKRRSNLVGVWYTVESAYQRAMIKYNSTAIQQLTVAMKDELSLAHTLVG